MATFRRGPGRLNAAVALVASLIALVALEGAVRLALPRPGFDADAANPVGLYVPHPGRGYTLAPRFAAHVVTDDLDYRIVTNAWGLRGGAIGPRGCGPRILALGDSFTFGWGVAASEAWPAGLERRLRRATAGEMEIEVINAGVPGYGMAQIAALGDDLVPRLKPDLVIVGVYLGGYWRIADPYVLVDGHLVRRSVLSTVRVVEEGVLRTAFTRPWARSLDLWLKQHYLTGAWLAEAYFRLAKALEGGPADRPDAAEPPAPVAKAERDLAAVEEIVASMRRRVESSGSRLLVLLVNHQDRDGSFSAREEALTAVMAEFLARNQIAYVSPLAALRAREDGTARSRLGRDGHWSAEAHAIAAELLADALLENEPLRRMIVEGRGC